MRMRIRPFERADANAVIQLWAAADLVRPWNDPQRDIERKLAADPELFLVGEHASLVVATAMVGYDGHRGWVHYLAVAPEAQGRGHGRALMQHAEQLLTALGCAKLNLQIRAGNAGALAFYRTLGYAEDAVIGMGKRLIPDH